jgi:hypothetical protein
LIGLSSDWIRIFWFKMIEKLNFILLTGFKKTDVLKSRI